MSALVLLLLALLGQQVESETIVGGAYNLLNRQQINYTWMEIGFASLTDTEWFSITSTATNLRDDKNYSVFISLPEYGGSTNEDGFPLVPKLKGSPTRNPDGTLTFKASLIQPNDTACSKNWTTPKPIKTAIHVSWLLVQNGVYNISGNMFQVNSHMMGRDNSVIAFNDRPALYHNLVVFNYTSGCDPNDPEAPCTYKASNPRTVNNWACDVWYNCAKTWLHLGALQQIQTDINRFEGESMWLSIRSRNVYTDRIELLMTPHSVGPDVGNYHGFYTTYETLVPELVSYFVYEQDVRIRCIEGLHIETNIDYPITSRAKYVNFFFVYDYPPGLFGMIGSLMSIADPITLRVFNNTPNGAFYITQEDKCYDEEVEHIANESAFTFAIGESTVSDPSIMQTDCRIVYNNDIPTGQPSQGPSSSPTGRPSHEPSSDPTTVPSQVPSGQPSSQPSGVPSSRPSAEPSAEPSGVPSAQPTGEPSSEPSSAPSSAPFGGPSRAPQTSPPTGQPSGSPSGVPSASPSGQPTGAPTGEPSSVPSGVPSGEPTDQPTKFPTAHPTATPTRRPTRNPTRFPTAIPTLNPTPTPTWDTPRNCTFQFMLIDTFGDGWVDVWANFTTTDMHPIEYEEVQSELHQPNCTYKIVTMLSLSCSIEVSMMNGLTGGNGNVYGAIAPWENYWHINFKGTRYVGGVDSFWKVLYGRVVEEVNMVNYDPEDDRNDCHECKHPKPKRSKELFGDDGNPHHDPPPAPAPPAGGKDKDKGHGPAGKKEKDEESSSDTSGDNSGESDHSSEVDGSDESHERLGGTADMKQPKTKPKSAHPPPPYLVQIALYDQVGDGYYDPSGGFDTLYSRTDYSEIDLKTTFPNVLSYPKYYLMTKDRKRLVKAPGSLCPTRDIEYCEEALPYNGKFVFRFAGFEPWKADPNQGKDEATWRFCGMSGGINEEFEFEMRNGKCVPLTNTLTDEAYCQLGFESAIEFALTLNVTGAFADVAMLTERDTALLEGEISQLFPSNVKAVVVAVEHATATSFRVELKMTVIAEELGYQGNSDDAVQALLEEVPTLCGKFLENDLLLTTLLGDLDKSAGSENDPLRLAEKISLQSVALLDVHFQDPKAGGAFALPPSGSSSSSSSSQPVQMISSYVPQSQADGSLDLSGSVGVVSFTSLVVVGLVVAFAVARSGGASVLGSNTDTQSLLPSASTHDLRVHRGDTDADADADSSHALHSPRRMSVGEVDKLQAVHFEDDDLDLYNKYMNKKAFL